MENLDTEKIEQYLDGQLSLSEQKQMAERIKADAEFAEAVELHELTMQGIEQFGLNEVKKNIGGLDETLANEGFFLTTEEMDGYLEGKLDNQQKEIMEKRLNKDADFKTDFDLHQLTKEGIEKKGAETEFADLFKNLDNDLEEEGFFQELDTTATKPDEIKEKTTAKIVRFPFRKLAIAASVALVLGASWWVFQPTPAPEMIYANHFSPFNDELSDELKEIGFINKSYYDLLENGIKAYNDARIDNVLSNDNYNKAKESFTQYRQVAPTDDEFYPTATLYLAIAHLGLEEVQQAISLLTSITQQKFPQQIDAQWYLALSYLKNDQPEKAIPILNGLDKSSYKEQVQMILKMIR